jgi:hypothetical protein
VGISIFLVYTEYILRKHFLLLARKRISNTDALVHIESKNQRVFSAIKRLYDRILFGKKLSRQTSLYPVLRQGSRETPHISDKQFYIKANNDRSFVQMSMADRTLFQVDQAIPAHQVFLWDIRKCSQNTNLDSYHNLCFGCNSQKRLKIEASLYTVLQILSVTIFDKSPILQVLLNCENHIDKELPCNQLDLFE